MRDFKLYQFSYSKYAFTFIFKATQSNKFVGPEKGRFFFFASKEGRRLSTFTTDSSGQLNILGHDGNSLSVNSAQVGVFEQSDQIGFASFLQSHNSGALETEIGLEILGDFSHQTLEWQLADQKLGGLLITTDFSESDGSWPVTMGFLNTSGGWCAFTCSFGSQLLPRSLSSSTLTSCLLGTCHAEIQVVFTETR